MAIKPANPLQPQPAAPLLCKADDGGDAPRILFIGLDAATWVVIEPLLREGKLPHMARLIQRGTAAEFKPFIPSESPLIWTSIATGVDPSQHGIQSFSRRLPGTDQQVPLRSEFRRAAAFWNLLTDAGKSVITIKWWASWPAEPVRGATISARLQRDLASGQTWPAYLFPEMDDFREQGGGSDAPHGVVSLPGKAPAAMAPPSAPAAAPASAAAPQMVVDSDLAGERDEKPFDDMSVAALARYALAKYDPTVFAVYFKSIDKIQHFLWRYHDYRTMAGQDPGYRRKGTRIDELYVDFDQVIGQLVALAGPRTITIIVSDHGMEDRDSISNLYSLRNLDGDKLLAELGLLVRDGATDWAATRIYSYANRCYEWAVDFRVNLEGREPAGSVAPGEAAAVVAMAKEQLARLEMTDGSPLFTSVADGADGVDISATLNPSLSLDANLALPAGQPRPLREFVIQTPQPEGVHIDAPPGIFIAAGGPFNVNARPAQFTAEEILPTLLYALNVGIPQDLPAKPRLDCFRDDYAAAHPPRYVAATSGRAAQSDIAVQPGDEELLNELRALGYIE